MTEESHGGCKPQMTSYPNGLTEGGGMQEGCGMGRGEEEGVGWGGGAVLQCQEPVQRKQNERKSPSC